MVVRYFKVIPRSLRARKAINAIRVRSSQFKKALRQNDEQRQDQAAEAAWSSMTQLFECLRNERDYKYLDASELQRPVGLIVERVEQNALSAMVARTRLDRHHPDCKPLTQNDALNKLAHYDESNTTYRIDGRGAHFLLLVGSRHGHKWIAEFLVSRLCQSAAEAAKTIRQCSR